MKITILEEAPPLTVIELEGSFDLYSTPDLRAVLDSLQAENKKRLLIDIRAVDSIDSSGLGLLINMHGLLEERGGKLAVMNASGSISRVFQLTQLDQRLYIFPDEQRARQAFAGMPPIAR